MKLVDLKSGISIDCDKKNNKKTLNLKFFSM